MNREALIEAFLSRTKWQSAERHALGQDASFRQYWRLHMNDQSALLMDAPPPEKPVSLFADIAKFLRHHALHAPEIYAMDDANGLMLIEDFGDDTFTRILHQHPDQEWTLYELAIDALITLHQINSFEGLSLARYEPAVINDELQLYLDWFFPAMSGKPATSAQTSSFFRAWTDAFSQCAALPEVVVLRDYHVDNLMRLSQHNRDTLCGLLDFQDALMGSPAYDLISLLEDARRDISPELKHHCLDQYFSSMSAFAKGAERVSFDTALNVFGAQRHAKVLGIFVRLYKRDDKSSYLKHLPRVLSLYRAAIDREPTLAPVAIWTRQHLPLENIPATF